MRGSPGQSGSEGLDPSYSRGIELYSQHRYAEAAQALAALRRRGDAMGDVGTYYEGMAYRAMGIEALRTGKYDSAEQHFLNASDALGEKANLAGYLATLYSRTGRYGQCEAAVQRDQSGGEIHRVRRVAHAQWRDGRRQEAMLTLRKALRDLGPSSELLIQVGLFHAAEGSLGLARAEMKAAVEADCSDGRAHYHLALVEAASGNVAAALGGMQRAFELRPDDLKLAYQLALTARAASQMGLRVSLRLPDRQIPGSDSPMRQMAAYLITEPDFVASFLALPQTQADKVLFGMLSQVLERSLSDHPGYADLNYYHSAVLERLGRLGEAMERARRSVLINPTYVKGHIQCGRLSARLGDDAPAIEHLRKAIDAGGDWPDVHCHLAELLLRAQAVRPAQDHLARALELNPEYIRAKRATAALAA